MIATPIRRWSQDGFELVLLDDGRTDSDGRCVLHYIFRDEGRTIFRGSDFRPSPLHATDSDEAVYALLGFLSLQAGDTDDEYFARYTPAQLAWRDARADELALIVADFEHREEVA